MRVKTSDGRFRFASVVLLALGVGLLAGCQAGGRGADVLPTVPRDGNAALIMHISDQPLVTAEAAYRAVHVLATGEVFAGEFDELAAVLRDKRLIAARWAHTPGQFVDRGTIGFMVCRACEIRSGLNWVLSGWGRYAWRELQRKGIAGGGSERALISGGEFVGLLARAEDYLHESGKRDVDRLELDRAPG